MIIREWRGRASSSQAGAYPKHFREKVIPELRHVPGFAGAQLGRRQLGDKIEFLVLTRWRSMDAIRAFAGKDVEKAVVEPDAVAALRIRQSRAALRRRRGRVIALARPANRERERTESGEVRNIHFVTHASPGT